MRMINNKWKKKQIFNTFPTQDSVRICYVTLQGKPGRWRRVALCVEGAEMQVYRLCVRIALEAQCVHVLGH